MLTIRSFSRDAKALEKHLAQICEIGIFWINPKRKENKNVRHQWNRKYQDSKGKNYRKGTRSNISRMPHK